MTKASGELTRIVAGERVIDVFGDVTSVPRQLKVTIRTDNGEWTFDEPGWRPLFYGFGDHRVYIWSARRLILLPSSGSAPESFETDEDLFYAFETKHGFILVCELSVRLVAAGREVSRINFDDVVLKASLFGSMLTLRDFDGNEVKVVVNESGLARGGNA